jgi:hypothetical protein
VAFPPSGTTVPTLQNYQLSFNGYVFGPNTALEILKIEGLDLPGIRSGDAGRPRDQGLFVGLDVMGGGEFTITGQLAADSVSFQHAWASLAAATLPGGSTETPLFLSLPGYGTIATLARVRKRSIPVDIKFALGNLADVNLMFASSDPRWYSTPTQTASVSPPSVIAGFSFPLKFPLSFGGGSVAGALSVNNQGNYETRPKLVVEGPCTNPSITNAGSGANLTFNLVMAAGDRLVIDTDLHTAIYFTSGSSIGSTRLYALAQGSQWFTLEPGVSTIQFLAGSGEGTLTVEYASAWIV